MGRLLTVDETAEMLGVAKQTLYNWVHQRRVPCVKVSRTKLSFDEDDLQKWLDAHRVPMDEDARESSDGA